jgi:hypothetical protein
MPQAFQRAIKVGAIVCEQVAVASNFGATVALGLKCFHQPIIAEQPILDFIGSWPFPLLAAPIPHLACFPHGLMLFNPSIQQSFEWIRGDKLQSCRVA